MPPPPIGVNVAVGLVVLLNWLVEVLGPLVTVHVPVPTVAVLADNVALPVLQIDWLLPALDVVGVASLVNVTVDEDEHKPFVIVHCNTVLLPAVTPVTVVVFEVAVVILPGPLTFVHSPVPTLGLLPAKVNVLVLHCSWLLPALDAVAARSF